MNPLPDTFERRATALRTLLGTIRDPQERLAWVIDRARTRPPFPKDYRNNTHLVPGCAARLWFHADCVNDQCRFSCDSDSAVLKAFAGLLCELYDGLSTREVADCEPAFLTALDIVTQLTENRRRTIGRVREVIREFAALHGSHPGGPEPAGCQR